MFWHRFWIRFCTPLASNSSFVGDRFSLDLLNRNSIDFVQKWLPKAGDANHIFPYFFAPVPQEVFRTVRSLTLVPFGHPFGSMLVVFGICLYPLKNSTFKIITDVT